MKKFVSGVFIFCLLILIVYAQNALRVSQEGNVGIGVENPEVKLDVIGEVRSTVGETEFYMVPRGAIIMWSGLVTEIPSGWGLCDGSQGTPDLQGRFVVGYNSVDADYDIIGNTGGEKNHTLTIAEMPAHTHSFRVYDFDWDHKVARSGADDRSSPGREETSSSGGNQPHENRPPYYVLAYIMKL